MNWIKSINIIGFKKFKNFHIDLNKKINILVGENEAGKSTILEAIDIVINQRMKSADKSFIKEWFNVTNLEAFYQKPSLETLPEIILEVEFELDGTGSNDDYFYGINYGKRQDQPEKFGIRFHCSFDEELGLHALQSIESGELPLEYYNLDWKTFGGNKYQAYSKSKPLSLIAIDTSKTDSNSSFNYYNKTLFDHKYDEDTKIEAKNKFRNYIEKAVNELNLPGIDDKREFGINPKKVLLESVLSVFEDSIPLENRGSGMENLIKTQIALDRRNNIQVVLLEEPENHLDFPTLKSMLAEIQNQQNESQLIITTHNSLISTSLDLRNILWIADNQVSSLSGVDEQTAMFFKKATNNAFLQFLLSTRVILVEGATEYLMIPYFYKQITGRSVEQDKISIISAEGISYNRYLSVAEHLDKKVAVITDNDGIDKRIDNSNSFNKQNIKQHIFMGATTDDWTWEVALLNCNDYELMKQLAQPKPGAKYLVHKQQFDPVLGKMLKNKVQFAYDVVTRGTDLNCPEYVKEAIEWIRK